MNIIKSEYIGRKLAYIKSIVEEDTKQKLYNINTTSEYIFMHLLNDTFEHSLVNANDEKANFPAIDLIDTKNKIVIQVTSSTSTKKVRVDTLEKFEKLVTEDKYKQYADYTIKIFYIKEKPTFSSAIIEEFEKKGLPQSSFLGIEDINNKVNTDSDVGDRVYKRLKKIFDDNEKSINIPSQLTSKLGKDTIVGRVKELQEIDQRLNSSSSLLLINGIGGIGKSNIASYYLHHQKEQLDYYGFFEGLESFVAELRPRLNLKQEKPQEAFMEALSELSKLKGEKLLVIDDVKNAEENRDNIERILALKASGYKVLFTSREEIAEVDSYYLDILSMDDAKLLFHSIYKKEIEESLLEEILSYLDCHAFFVEMTAKTLQNRKRVTPQELKEQFVNGNFPKVSVKRRESFQDYLQKLFTLEKLDQEEILMLKQLSVLPSIEIEFEKLTEIFDKQDDDEFEEILNYLVEKGCLSQVKDSYKLHQIIKEYIFDTHLPKFKEIELILDYFLSILRNSSDSKVAVDNKKILSILILLYKL